MNSVILQIASRYVRFWLILFAILALFRGHHYPGGGFIGGLLAALATVYSSYAYNPGLVRHRLWVQPGVFISMGLIVIFISILPSVFMRKALMKGMWFKTEFPIIGLFEIGTPLIFDIGVFLTVIGVTLMFLFSFSIHQK